VIACCDYLGCWADPPRASPPVRARRTPSVIHFDTATEHRRPRLVRSRKTHLGAWLLHEDETDERYTATGQRVSTGRDVAREQRIYCPTNVCGHPYSSEIRRYVSGLGARSPASISRYSRTLTPINQAARQTRSPSRFRSRRIIPGYAAKVGMRRRLSRRAEQRDARPDERVEPDELRAGPSHHLSERRGESLSGSPAWPALYPASSSLDRRMTLTSAFPPDLSEGGLSGPRARGATGRGCGRMGRSVLNLRAKGQFGIVVQVARCRDLQAQSDEGKRRCRRRRFRMRWLLPCRPP
jgi:hypothetical protein